MAAQQLVVRVVDGPSEIDESVQRPVRLTPTGYAGVVYAGAVYPLPANHIVDISGSSWEVEDCNRFLLPGVAVPYAPSMKGEPKPFEGFDGQWSIESNEFGHYLLFNSSERVAASVVDALESAGLSVQRWDVSHRQGSDGKFYDWFARLRFKGSRDEALSKVSAVFSPVVADHPVETRSVSRTTSRIEDLEAQVEELLGLTLDLRERLSSSDDEVKLLQRRLETALERESKLTRDIDRALDYQKSLHAQIGQLRSDSQQAADTKLLLRKHSETEEFLELAFAENADLRRTLAVVRERGEEDERAVLALRTTVAGLQEQLEELGEQERERRRAAETRRAPRRGVPGFIDSAFARLAFVLDSVEVIANMEAPSAVLRSLIQVDMGEVIGKDLEGIWGWREISKLATGIAGSEDMGRIYYKPDGERVLVSVHVKQSDKEQRRHIERLRSTCG